VVTELLPTCTMGESAVTPAKHSSDVQFRVARIKSTAANALEIVR